MKTVLLVLSLSKIFVTLMFEHLFVLFLEVLLIETVLIKKDGKCQTQS